MIKVAFVTDYNSSDITKYSGLGYFMAKALQSDSISVERVGPLTEYFSYIYKAKQMGYKWLDQKRHLRDREPEIIKSYARQIQRVLKGKSYDVVFSPGTVSISLLNCRQPIVFWADATFAAMINYYPSFTNLTLESIRNGHQMEQLALNRAKFAVYSSSWAAHTAISNYDVNPTKIKVIPFGANIHRYHDRDVVMHLVKSRSTKVCKLLFLGTDWHRKGGDVAFEIAEKLNAQGLKTELTVIGSKPPLEYHPQWLRMIPYLSKKTENETAKLYSLLEQSHFLVLPARAEAFGHVICEANAYAVPAIVSDTGGIATQDKTNGRVLSYGATVSEYCGMVDNYLSDRQSYEALAINSYEHFLANLNWQTCGQKVQNILRQIV